MKNLIISLAVKGREDYIKLQQGLKNSIDILYYCCKGYASDIRLYNSFPDYCTPHSEIPYKFKFDLIKKAVEEGYTKIFWLDSTMRLLKDPFVLLDKSESGIVAFNNEGHPLYKYISDLAADNLKDCYRDLKEVKQTWGGALGFDFTMQASHTILNEVIKQANIGSFDNGTSNREGFVSHRHDQAVLSCLLHGYRVDLLPYGVIAAKKDVTDKTFIQYGD